MNTKFLVLSTTHPLSYAKTLIKSIGYMTVLFSLLYSINSPAPPATCTSVTTGMWNSSGTWDCASVPTNSNNVTIAATHAVTVDTNVSVVSITTAAATSTLNFAVNATPYTLSAGAGGITNYGTFNVTNAGAITSAATNGGTHGVYNRGTFTMGSGTLTTTASTGLGFENDTGSTFTGGAGLITANSFRNGNSGTPSFTVGSGGMTITADYYPNNGTVTLNGNITIGTTINSGSATVSGTGKMILSDAAHTITGPVNVHNLETATFSTGRTYHHHV